MPSLHFAVGVPQGTEGGISPVQASNGSTEVVVVVGTVVVVVDVGTDAQSGPPVGGFPSVVIVT